MSEFTCRLKKDTDDIIDIIMKKENFSTRNKCIEAIIIRYHQLQGELQSKIRECNNLQVEHDQLYSLVQQKVDFDKRLAEFFEKKVTKKKK